MYTSIIIAIVLFVFVLSIYIIRTVLEYKKNPIKVREFVQKNFDHDISKQEKEPSQAARFAPKNNRRTTRGRRWQEISMHRSGKKIYHHAHV